MCKSRRCVGAIEPRSRGATTTKNSGSSMSSSSSLAGSGNYYCTSASNSSLKDRDPDWSLSSTTTQAALYGIRESLSDTHAHIYDFAEICSATDNFRAAARFSPSSWRCDVRHRDAVVFRRSFRRPVNLSELRHRLSAVCRSHHTSVVKLLGASVSGNYIYLVYDYVPGANLGECLRNPRNPNFTVLSTWLSRMQVAADLADGLDYIHHSTGLGLSFVHNHINSSSVIVSDSSLKAKICHFGTAALCGEIDDLDLGDGEMEIQRSRTRVTRIEGTRGYMAPELQATGIATQKTDVYAFGVVVLELLSGKEALRYRVDEATGAYESESVIAAAKTAASMPGEGGVRGWVDRRLRDSFPVEVAQSMARIALDCVDADPGRRPDMGQVAGAISKLFLESAQWSEKMSIPTAFSVSFAPR